MIDNGIVKYEHFKSSSEFEKWQLSKKGSRYFMRIESVTPAPLLNEQSRVLVAYREHINPV